jgi:hypothetical protein
MRTSLCRLTICLALAAPAAAVQAEGVYKYTAPDGRVTYTDDPKALDGTARALEPAPPPARTAPALSEADRKLLEQAKQRAAALDRAIEDIVAAHAALRAAEARRDSGVEPLEGERQGRRYRPEYWGRQQQLERDIASARATLDEALARRNALR